MRNKIKIFIGIVLLGTIGIGCESTLNTADPSDRTLDNTSQSGLMALDATSFTAANDGLIPVNISGLTATDLAAAGVGTASRAEETLTLNIPAGATVEAVYIYWARRGNDVDLAPWAPSTILVNGSEVTGEAAGNGPVDNPSSFEPVETLAGITHKANITGMGIISAGSNTITVQDDPAAPAQPLGASVLVFYSVPDKTSELVLFDGVDFLWLGSGATTMEHRIALQTARPVTFLFTAAEVERTADLTLLIGDIEPEDAAYRPNSLKITVGENPTQVIGPTPSPFQGFQGAEWDNYRQSVSIPAGVDKLTVEPVSGPGTNPASLVWSFAGLTVEMPNEGGGEGCTPGFWRQSQHYDYWVNYSPSDILDDVFDIPSTLRLVRPENGKAETTMLKDAVELRGGDINALIRHGVAALLNASSPDVSYDLTVSEVISKFNAAVNGGDINAAKNEFESFNELGCSVKE